VERRSPQYLAKRFHGRWFAAARVDGKGAAKSAVSELRRALAN
jgi:hypothetical protein